MDFQALDMLAVALKVKFVVYDVCSWYLEQWGSFSKKTEGKEHAKGEMTFVYRDVWPNPSDLDQIPKEEQS